MPRQIERVAWFVDGFNLYYSLMSLKSGRYLWLDLGSLANSKIKHNQVNVKLSYFTALAESRTGSTKRQSDYLAALKLTSPFPIDIVVNSFNRTSWDCKNCDSKNKKYQEKQTDVALGVAMVESAMLDEYDTAFLISADMDFIPAIEKVKTYGKKVVIALPPGRRSFDLEDSASSVYHLKENAIRKSQLPLEIEVGARRITKPNFYIPGQSPRFRKWPLVHKGSD